MSHGRGATRVQPAYHNPVATASPSVPVATRHTEVTSMNYYASPRLGPFSKLLLATMKSLIKVDQFLIV